LKIYKNIIFPLIFIGFFSIATVANNSHEQSIIEKKLENLNKYDISTFYDSTLSLFLLLQNSSDKDLGEKWTNELFEVIREKKGHLGNRLHWIHMEFFTDSLKLNYLNSAEVLAKTYDSKLNIAWSNYTKSVFYEQKHIYDKSIKYLLIAKDIYEELENNKYLSLINHLFGKLYLASQQYEIAIYYYKIAIENLTGSTEFVNERKFILLNNIRYATIKLGNYNLHIKSNNRALQDK
jgi:hypothetical protein